MQPTWIKRSFFAVALLASAFLLSAAQAQSLFDRLGGLPAIECVVDTSVPIILNDDRISGYFAGELNAGQPQSIRDALVDYFCDVSGGPCEYKGRNMVCAHVGLGIDNQAHNAFISDLEQAAGDCGADPAVFAEVSKLMFGLRPKVVQDDPGEAFAAFKRCRKDNDDDDDDDDDD